jgi:DNA-binding transcriptional LysR family regulator
MELVRTPREAPPRARSRAPLSPDAAGRWPTAHELSAFVCLAETLHFGQAATILGLAQSSLSEAIRRLEAKLDVVLLERTSRQVSLTDAGIRLLPVARLVMQGLSAAKVAVQSPARRGGELLRIGIEGPGLAELNQPIIAAMAERFPEARLVLKECLGLPHAFFDHRLDVALVRTPFDDARLVVHPVASEPRGLLVPPDHRLAGAVHASVHEVLDEPFVAVAPHAPSTRDHWLATERRGGRPPLIGGEAFTVQEVVNAVGHLGLVTTGCASLARFHPFPEVAFVPAVDLEPEELGVAVLREEERPLVLEFVALVRELAEELADEAAPRALSLR